MFINTLKPIGNIKGSGEIHEGTENCSKGSRTMLCAKTEIKKKEALEKFLKHQFHSGNKPRNLKLQNVERNSDEQDIESIPGHTL